MKSWAAKAALFRERAIGIEALGYARQVLNTMRNLALEL